jgi:cobalt-zinc-cadmium efflux system protein
MGHDHHHHDHSTGNLKVAFFLNIGFTILEFFGGIYVNSVAIMSDAIHDLGDSLSLGTSWYLQHKSKQKADHKFSYGYRRFSLFGAMINSLVLIVGSVIIIKEAIERIISPESTDANGILWFAIVGVLVNGYAAWKLSSGKTMNERVVSWHLLEDVLGWVAVLIVAIVLQFKDIQYLDPALSLLITLYILWNVIIRLKDTLFLFLQGKPDDIDIHAIESEIVGLEHVDSIHHTHIWSLDGEHHVFSTHVKLISLQNLKELRDTKERIKDILDPYHFEHYAIETELDEETCRL